MTDDVFSKGLKTQKEGLHFEKIDEEQLLLVGPHPGQVLIEEVSAPPRARRVRIQVKICRRCPESNPRLQFRTFPRALALALKPRSWLQPQLLLKIPGPENVLHEQNMFTTCKAVETMLFNSTVGGRHWCDFHFFYFPSFYPFLSTNELHGEIKRLLCDGSGINSEIENVILWWPEKREKEQDEDLHKAFLSYEEFYTKPSSPSFSTKWVCT